MFRDRRQCLLFLLFTFAFLPSLAQAQANVNEGLETASLYVDGTHGSDSNPGTQTQPLATIGKAASLAMSNNQQNVGTRVIINPGTYREAIAINHMYKSSTLPITFQAAKNGTVIVSGADVWTEWSQSGNLYTNSWPYRWGTCTAESAGAPLQAEILLRQEMILVNGTLMTQVLSKTAMQPGTFFADEATSTVYVWPASGTNMSTATVEVATRPALFTDQNQSDVVLRGLIFQYANSCRQSAAVTFTGSTTNNILIDSDTFSLNNSVGLSFDDAQQFTVQNSTANHNGQKGFATYQVKNGFWQSDTGNYNNWRGAQAAYYTWDAGSVRLFLDHGSTFNNIVTLYNQTEGIHFDTDNENMTIDSHIEANNLDGFLLEKSQGPITVSNSYFCNNNVLNFNYAGGFVFRNSSNATLSGNVFYANHVNQIAMNGIVSGISVTNWETGQTYNLQTDHLTFSNNTIATNSNTARTWYDGYLGGIAWTDFIATLNSNDNVWSAGTNSSAFAVPTPRSGSATTFAGWQTLTSQDQQSSWGTTVTQPRQCKVQPDAPDYWLLTCSISPVNASAAGLASFNLSTVALGGRSGMINLTIDGLSAVRGTIASFSPASITTSGSSVLTVSVPSKAAPGTYPLTVIANSGNLTRTVTVWLVVP